MLFFCNLAGMNTTYFLETQQTATLPHRAVFLTTFVFPLGVSESPIFPPREDLNCFIWGGRAVEVLIFFAVQHMGGIV